MTKSKGQPKGASAPTADPLHTDASTALLQNYAGMLSSCRKLQHSVVVVVGDVEVAGEIHRHLMDRSSSHEGAVAHHRHLAGYDGHSPDGGRGQPS
jgi:hypothetical protein